MTVIETITYRFSENEYKNYIKPLLKQKHIKIQWLADVLGTSKSYLYKMLYGDINAKGELVSLLVAHGIMLPFEEIILDKGRKVLTIKPITSCVRGVDCWK